MFGTTQRDPMLDLLYQRTERAPTIEGLLTHLATTDCFVTQPHSALECGIVTAWWRLHEEADTAMRRQHEDEQRDQNDQARA